MRQFLFIALITLIVVPLEVYAQGRMTFHDLPGLGGAATFTTQQYINALYVLAISLAAILAVLKLIWAGTQYMTSEKIPSKQSAKANIQGALLGLIIILAAVTILNTINPNLTNLNILRNATPSERITGNKSTATTHEQTNISAYTDAENRASECGGKVVKVADGNFKVVCPGSAPAQNNNSNNQQMVGWPRNFSNFADYMDALDQCRQGGGSPGGGEVSMNQYVVECFR